MTLKTPICDLLGVQHPILPLAHARWLAEARVGRARPGQR